jgi:predicted secreted protein
MAKSNGALFVLKKKNVVIGGGRALSMSVNGTPINTTDKNSSGFAEYLAGVLTGRSLEFSADGQEEDQVLRNLALSSDGKDVFLDDLTFNFGNGSVISGSFVMTGYTENGPYEDAQTYTANFGSDGAWVFTPAAVA